MSTVLDYQFRINGVLSTDKTVLQNIETLCSAAGAWLSYDIHDGLWSVVINTTGNSVASFGDSNIIGPISVSSTGLTELYNSVKVEFPHIDLKDNLDFVTLTIPDEDRNDNEPDNELNIQYDILNNPVQAQYLGFIELKQNRLDQVIKFTTDFSKIGLKAGDLIDVTNEVYGYTAKMFRIVSITENDNDDGGISLDITALEYDENVYSTDDLYRYTREDATGITTIGSIGVPGTPQVTKFQSNSRPHILVESTSPTGIVESMEYWISTDVPPAVTIDSNRNYTLLSTVGPTAGNTFAYGTTVRLDFDSNIPANFMVKTRGINSITSGPFSANSGATTFTADQTPNSITDNTAVKDGSGTSILGTLGMAGLMALLNGLFQGNTAAGSLFKTIANLEANTGAIVSNSSGTNANTLWQGAARYVSSTTPTGNIKAGDVWFKIP